jgi:biopolymer transport protein ExbD
MSIQSRLADKDDRPAPDFGLAQVNIVLLLVLFFLVVGTIVETSEQAVRLPETTDLPLERLPRPLLLIDGGETWQLDGEALTPIEVVARLIDNPDGVRRVHLLMAQDLPADVMFGVLRRLEDTGLGVALVTIKTDATAGTEP